jgi:hypothetical protein
MRRVSLTGGGPEQHLLTGLTCIVGRSASVGKTRAALKLGAAVMAGSFIRFGESTAEYDDANIRESGLARVEALPTHEGLIAELIDARGNVVVDSLTAFLNEGTARAGGLSAEFEAFLKSLNELAVHQNRLFLATVNASEAEPDARGGPVPQARGVRAEGILAMARGAAANVIIVETSSDRVATLSCERRDLTRGRPAWTTTLDLSTAARSQARPLFDNNYSGGSR